MVLRKAIWLRRVAEMCIVSVIDTLTRHFVLIYQMVYPKVIAGSLLIEYNGITCCVQSTVHRTL